MIRGKTTREGSHERATGAAPRSGNRVQARMDAPAGAGRIAIVSASIFTSGGDSQQPRWMPDWRPEASTDAPPGTHSPLTSWSFARATVSRTALSSPPSSPPHQPFSSPFSPAQHPLLPYILHFPSLQPPDNPPCSSRDRNTVRCVTPLRCEPANLVPSLIDRGIKYATPPNTFDHPCCCITRS